MQRLPVIVFCIWGLAIQALAQAGDWPMWRCTAERSAATDESLPGNLQLLWRRSYPPRQQTWDDPLNLDLMTYDRVFEPIVLDGRLFVGFNDRDKLTAFDADTGKELWSFFTDAPVRLPPAGWNGRVYFCSDDGHLYCVNAADGRLEWQFRGAPNAQHALGNQRISSAWPARGGPVIRDGQVYFAASIWPFMGTFLYALDAQTGAVSWVNDSTGAQFIQQPHSAPSFAGVAPQGALVATQEFLVVPGGRSVPAVFDRDDGSLKYFEINAGGKGTGGSFVAANDESFFVHTRLKGTRGFDLQTGVKTAFMPNEPVLHGGLIYSAEVGQDDRALVRAYNREEEVVWEIEADGRGDLILAGNQLYAAGANAITAIRLPDANQAAEVVWSLPVEGQVERLLAADGKLFAVTLEGDLMALGTGEQSASPKMLAETPHALEVDPAARRQLTDLLDGVDAQGYAFWFGASDEALIAALAADSPFVQLAVVDEDAARVDRLRRSLDAAGHYGRVTAHQAQAAAFQPPRYVAHLVVLGRELTASLDEVMVRKVYEAVRPYGGELHLLADENHQEVAAFVEDLDLEQARVEITKQGVRVRREGALPGAADWTHQYGDIANTIKSDDSRVKLPLGILWFGGSSNMDVLPRHGHGPPEQVVGGRLFIQGMNSLSARDVYTGRVLWKRDFEDLGTYDVYYDETYENTPLDPKYNQVHIPGANARGTNYVVTDDRVYIVEGAICHVLDPASGELLQDIPIGEAGSDRQQWSYLGVYEDILIGGVGFAMYRDRHDVTIESDKELRSSRAGFGSKSLDRAASMALIGFDRHSGERLWQVRANHSFWHNGIVAGNGRIYCLDRNPSQIEDVLKRRGRSRPDTYRIVAFDAHSGEQLWQHSENVFGTWLGYSEEHDLLLQAGAAASDRLYDEVGQGMAVYTGSDGSVHWEKQSLKYSGPCILHNDLIITNANSYSESAGAFRLSDGEPLLMPNPLTGELQPWKVTRAYGCNTMIASENLLTFRSGAAGFYDLLSHSGTGNFGGFKSGCTSNLVVANGVLNAPDYTRTCSCAYQNQTSLALVHMPEVEMWSINTAAMVEADGTQVRKVGINFGAPGDRRDETGLLWLEHPVVAGESPPLEVSHNPQATIFQHHSSSLSGAERAWVLASGLRDVTELRIGLQLEKKASLSEGVSVAHADDDAEENTKSGEVDTGSSDLELVEDGDAQLVGIRFNDLQLRRGTHVRSAYVQFTCDETSSDPTSVMIAAQDVGHAARFSDGQHDLSSRPLTATQVAWRPAPWAMEGEAGEAQRTPDLSALVQSVIDRPDWEPGNSLALLISGTGKRVAEAWQDGAARLMVDAPETAADDSTQTPLAAYRVRLYFGSPSASASGKSVFSVQLQGEPAGEQIELDPAGPQQDRYAVRTVENVLIGNELHVKLIPSQGSTCLSGIEIVRQEND
jgi:outer membrane protein assembly factor BamB